MISFGLFKIVKIPFRPSHPTAAFPRVSGGWEKGLVYGQTLKKAGSYDVEREGAGTGATGGQISNEALGDSNHREE